ncbi:restriction endonuclease [Hyalangium rubrum]|uniref:Restriction endonuclease n=1 Tax=Hyalangium rubrum TaxID=3103134 RepID=A0ABU5HIB4_9BACT|nr:restriction endonuclease [Hyalangium sp. s54d21]MDY7232995.1 restriction endonuclease [Hyalangium sp. s54d21]
MPHESFSGLGVSMKSASPDQWDFLDGHIARLRDDTNMEPQETEVVLGKVLEPLFKQEGYELEYTGGLGDQGIDFWARRTSIEGAADAGETIGIQAKFYKGTRHVPMTSVQQLIGAALLQGLSRVVLVSNGEFSKDANAAVAKTLPLRIELLDIGGLQHWVNRLRDQNVDVEAEVRMMMRELSGRLARLIAAAPTALAQLEWRDVERVMAEVFDGLGFGVTLTPGSKDGGKDIILTCLVQGKRAEYYVEIKHWRSSTRVGRAAVEKLLKVIVEEKKEGGLFLSTYGFTNNAFEQLTTIDKQKLRFGDQEKMVSFCQSYVKARAGLWSPPENLTEILLSE